MASKSEMRAEHMRDSIQWSHRVVRALQAYRQIKNEATLAELRELVKEKNDLGYSYSHVDPFGVAGITEEDMDVLRQLDVKAKKQNETESENDSKIEKWRQKAIEVLREYHDAEAGKDLSRRTLAFVEVRKLVRAKINSGYSFDDIDPDGKLGVTDEDIELLESLSEKMESENGMER